MNLFPQSRRIAFLGDFVPRRCGIATFTHHLCEAVAAQEPDAKCIVVAVNDRPEGYDYPRRVRFEIDHKDLDSYLAAADVLKAETMSTDSRTTLVTHAAKRGPRTST